MTSKKFTGSTRSQPIRRILRHRSSRKYFKDGRWTDKPEEANNFSDVVEAAQVCARLNLRDVEVAIRLEPAASDVFCTPIR